jgi:hypothetical protein
VSLRSTWHARPRSCALAALALAATFLTIVSVALAAGPKSGHYGEAKSTLPVSFNLKGHKLSALALGPAQLACAGGSTGQATLTMPKLTGFPTERLVDGAVGEYTYYFAQQSGAFTSIGSSAAPPHGALYIQVFAAFYGGKKFQSHGGIQIQYNADANGTPDPTGPYACSGSWDGTFAKHR